MQYTHPQILIHIQTQVSHVSCPCLFLDRVSQSCSSTGGEVCTARAYNIVASSLSQSPGFLLPSLYQAEVTDDSLFPSHTWQWAEKNRKENKGKRLSNYFKQHTKLKHCAELSKGQHPERCGFPAVWGEGNAKGISAELTLKGERERERERQIGCGEKERKQKKYALEYRLPNEVKDLASSDGFNVGIHLPFYTATTVHST